MRILQVNKFFDLHGGAEVYMHKLSAELSARGHNVHFFSTKSPKNLPSSDEARFVTRYHLDRRDGLPADLKKAANFVWNVEAKRAFEQLVDEVKPDVIHLHNIYHHLSTSILPIIRKRKIPCVQTLHDYKLACPNYKMFTEGAPCERCKGGDYTNAIRHHCLGGFVNNALAALEMGLTKARQSYESTVNLFLCPSRFMKEKMEDWGEPAGKMRYAPNPGELTTEAATLGGGYILYAGRLSQEKGLDSFLKAASKVPELPVKLAGRGPEEARLRKIVEDAGAHHIEFLGFQSPEVLGRIRSRAEAIVYPSIAYENASLSILEGLGQGLPCLVTRIGGNPELVEDGVTGFLAKPDDVDDWLRVLRRFQAVPFEVRKKMGEAGRAKIQNGRTWQQHADLILSFYREAGAKQ